LTRFKQAPFALIVGATTPLLAVHLHQHLHQQRSPQLLFLR
jgi:hypothetical protein